MIPLEKMNDNANKIILHLCCSEFGSDTLDYKNAGYDVRYVGKKIGVENYHPPANVYGIFANPPCTMFSIARTTAKEPRDLREGMRLVKECLRIIWECQYEPSLNSRSSNLKWWALENPGSGMLRYFLGKPAFEYQPYEFGEDRSKHTALWGHFNPPPKGILISGTLSRNVLGQSGRDRVKRGTDNRSIASPQFTREFFLLNP